MLRVIIFDLLLFGTCGYALWRGKFDARVVATVCIVANFTSYALLSPLTRSYTNVETGVLVVDLVTLSAFIYVALRSDRFWPLWISGLQLTTSIGHALKAMQPDLLPIAYAAAGRFWSYPILIILFVGTWRSHRRAVRGLSYP